MSVPTVDEDAWRTLEPGTAHPLQRLRAVRDLADAGINVGVLMAPIVPGFSSSRSKVERTIKAIADHGARFVGCNVMYLQDGTRTHFLKFIAREFPAMQPRFERLYTKKYPPEGYRKEIQGMVRVLQERYGLRRRGAGEDAGACRLRSPMPRSPNRSPSAGRPIRRRRRTRASGQPTGAWREPGPRAGRRPSGPPRNASPGAIARSRAASPSRR